MSWVRIVPEAPTSYRRVIGESASRRSPVRIVGRKASFRGKLLPRRRQQAAETLGQERLGALLQSQREGDWCRRKNRIISAEASGPCESV
jgi:hypothetical protein